MQIEISNRQKVLLVDEHLKKELDRVLRMILEEEMEDQNVELSLSFVDHHEIREINRTYRRIDRATDVLSFPATKEFFIEEERTLGDVVISTDAVKEQSLEYGHSEKRELLYLFVHGVLHLLGYDHLEEKAKKDMRKREEAILKRMNLSREVTQ